MRPVLTLRRRRCPDCAERVRREAKVCRFCGADLTVATAGDDPVARGAPDRRLLIVGGAATAVALVALLVWLLLPPTTPNTFDNSSAPAATIAAADALPDDPGYPPLPLGETLSWKAETAEDVVERQVGPLTVRIGKVGDGDAIAPIVEVGHGGATVTMTGERVGPSYEHRITAFQNRAGAAPVVMLQSFSGGAHCCNHVQLAGLSNGQLRVVDLGSWDGEQIDTPRDLSGDGVADFVFWDQAFLYAFASYAGSYSVPKVLNVVGGRTVDVSTRPAFRPLFAKEARRSGETCRTAEDGEARNGACPAYLAAAARTGQLALAWTDMLAAYDATSQWAFPTGCAVLETKNGCPEGQAIQYQSYPEALLAFLKRNKYIAPGWRPPEARLPAPAIDLPIDEEAGDEGEPKD